MQPTSLYPIENPFVIQRVVIPQKGRYKFTVPEGYEMVVCDGNKEAECLGSGRQVEIKGRRQPPGELYWIPLKPQTVSYLKGDRKILIVVRHNNRREHSQYDRRADPFTKRHSNPG